MDIFTGGLAIRICICFTPEFLSISTILIDVVPLTIESSINAIFLPCNDARLGLCFSLTAKCLIEFES